MYKKCDIFLLVFIIIIINLSLLANCGRFKRVVGSYEVECGVQPRVASLRNSSTLEHKCGATLLSPQFAVTAAHCVQHNKEEYLLQLNNYCGEPPPTARVLEIIANDSYDPITRAHDIALLRLALNLNDTSWISGTMLPTSSFGISGECTIYGYGCTKVDSEETTDKLQGGTLTLVSLDHCTDVLGLTVAPDCDSGMMCAVGDGVDACQGDSGSPLICGDNEGTIEAVCSYGVSCAVPGLPGVYTSISPHLQWITSVMQDVQKNNFLTKTTSKVATE